MTGTLQKKHFPRKNDILANFPGLFLGFFYIQPQYSASFCDRHLISTDVGMNNSRNVTFKIALRENNRWDNSRVSMN